MAWVGRLCLDYRRDGPRCVVHDRHDGPLRIQRSFYPEDPAICHNVLVHPPGGIAGGDTLDLDLNLQPHAHALLTTPGATRFYRSLGAPALQQVRARVDAQARLEWLPLETLAYSGCLAETRMRFELGPGAEMIGWDVLALGLPAAGLPFERGSYTQSIELPGCWLERGRIAAEDRRLLESNLGWGGHGVLATLWFGSAEPLAPARRDALLDAARGCIEASALRASAGATAPNPRLVVVRGLAARVEPAMQMLVEVWTRWRAAAWSLAACPPRVWRT